MLAFFSASVASAFVTTLPTTTEPGDLFQIDVQGAMANETIHVVLSRDTPAPGPCPPILGGACFGIPGPLQVVGTVVVDGRGNGRAQLQVPANVPVGSDWGLQLVAYRGGVNPELSAAYEINVLGTCSTVEEGFNDGPGFDDNVSMGGPQMWFAMRYRPAADVTVDQAQVFTGEVVGASSIGVWTSAGGAPGARLASGEWTVGQGNEWQGALLDQPVQLSAGVDYWVVWTPPNGAQATWDSSGSDLVDYRSSFDGGQTWGLTYRDKLKLRVLSCP